MLTFAFMTVVAVGLAAIMRAQPGKPRASVWSDAVERRLLHEHRLDDRSW
jgi:hypothetical protein